GLGIGISYLASAAIPSAATAFDYCATAIMIVSALAVVRLRKTRNTRRAVLVPEASQPEHA
ncbi:MAG TPA: hypothetical protein VFJ20_11930, partial [Gemmatimonadaceae bacterium]|nr:hypothetical protein [Gemmatimonadaceae bacterium]